MSGGSAQTCYKLSKIYSDYTICSTPLYIAAQPCMAETSGATIAIAAYYQLDAIQHDSLFVQLCNICAASFGIFYAKNMQQFYAMTTIKS
eukprot:16442-Heterococcus_DN1.PRE.5